MAKGAAPRLDADVEAMTRDQLVAEVKALRAGIRTHRDSTGQELCWHHPKLWGLLPEKTDPVPTVPAWPEFMDGCVRYRESLDTQVRKRNSLRAKSWKSTPKTTPTAERG